MSIFDKYNVNPYVRTYAGAPIEQYKQTAGALQKAMDTNLATRDKIEIAMNNIEAADVDEAFKKQKIAEYKSQLEAIAENPEYASSKVRALSKGFAMDEDLKEIAANKKRMADLQKEIKEGDFSDFQIQKFTDELERYRTPDEEGKSGLAAGRQFRDVNFYEETAINEKVDEQVKGILGEKYGSAFLDPATGMIKTEEGDIVSEERVRSSIQGALRGNKKISRQINDEAMFRFKQENKRAPTPEEYASYVSQYVEQTYIEPAVSKFSRESVKQNIKGAGKGSSLTSNGKYKVGDLVDAVPTTGKSIILQSEFTNDEPVETRYAQIQDLQSRLEAGEFTSGHEVVNAQNQLNILRGTLKQVLTNEDVIESAELRDIIGAEEDLDTLWKIMTPESDRQGLNSIISSLPRTMEEFDTEMFASTIRPEIELKHGDEVARAVGLAIAPQYSLNEARKRAREIEGLGYGEVPSQEQVDRQLAIIQEEKLQDVQANYENLLDKGFSRLQGVERYLSTKGYEGKELKDKAMELNLALSKNIVQTDYQNLLRDGMLNIATNRTTVGLAPFIGSEQQRDEFNNAIKTVFNQQDFDKSLLESFKVLEDGKLQPAEEADVDFEDYNTEDLEVVSIDAQGGLGLVEVTIPTVATGKEAGPPLRLALDLSNENFGIFREMIGDAAKRKADALYQMNDTGKQYEIARAVQYNYHSNDALQEIITFSTMNQGSEGGAYAELTDSYIYGALGTVIPIKDADGGIRFENANGDALFKSGQTFDNANLAYQALRDKATKQYRSDAEALTN